MPRGAGEGSSRRAGARGRGPTSVSRRPLYAGLAVLLLFRSWRLLWISGKAQTQPLLDPSWPGNPELFLCKPRASLSPPALRLLSAQHPRPRVAPRIAPSEADGWAGFGLESGRYPLSARGPPCAMIHPRDVSRGMSAGQILARPSCTVRLRAPAGTHPPAAQVGSAHMKRPARILLGPPVWCASHSDSDHPTGMVPAFPSFCFACRVEPGTCFSENSCF